MKTLRLPLHLDPANQSREAIMQRLELRADMAALHPASFRKFQTTRIGSRKPKKARIDRLNTTMEKFGG